MPDEIYKDEYNRRAKRLWTMHLRNRQEVEPVEEKEIRRGLNDIFQNDRTFAMANKRQLLRWLRMNHRWRAVSFHIVAIYLKEEVL